MDFETITRTILAHVPSIDAHTLVALAGALANGEAAPRDLSTLEKRVAFARSLPAVMDEVRADRKISAIKALREATRDQGFVLGDDNTSTLDVMGLKTAKDTLDSIMPPRPW